mgnify:CR=1 FL=1
MECVYGGGCVSTRKRARYVHVYLLCVRACLVFGVFPGLSSDKHKALGVQGAGERTGEEVGGQGAATRWWLGVPVAVGGGAPPSHACDNE